MKLLSPSLVGSTSLKALSILAALYAASPGRAASSTWTSTSDSDFNTAGNWSAGVPGSPTAANTDAANFTSTTPGTQTSVNLSASQTVQQVTLSTFNYTLTSTAGQTLTIDTNTAGSNNAIQVGNGTTQTFNGNVTLTDSLSAQNIGLAFATGATAANSNLIFGAGSTLTIQGGGLVTPSGGAFTGTGTISINGKIVAGANNLFNLTVGDTVIYNPTSQTGTSFATLRASSVNSIIDLQVAIPTSFGQVNIGGTGGLGGSAFLNAAITNNSTVIMNNTTTGITSARTFTFGSNAPTSSITAQSGPVTLSLANGTTMQNDVFEVDNSNTMTISGAITSTAGTTGVITSVNKTGNGTLVLSNVGNTYVTNGTNVTSGTLLATNTSGSATGPGPVSVSAAATLGGRGFITGPITLATGTSILAPGTPSGIAGQTAATGVLTLSGGINAPSGLTLNVNVNGGLAVGTLTLANTSTFGGTLTTNFFNLGGSTLKTATPYTLISGGTWTGTPSIATGSLPAGFTLDSAYGTGGYIFNTGTDTFTVQFAAVPEPGTTTLAGAGVLCLLGLSLGKRLRRGDSTLLS